MLNAESITDDQIRKLLEETLASADPHAKYGDHTIAGTCREALGEVHIHGSTRIGARKRCAEILNARTR